MRNGTLTLGGVNDQYASITLGSESLLFNEENGELVIRDGSSIIVSQGATLCLGDGSSTIIQGSGKIVIEDGGYLCVEQGADIQLQDENSYIIVSELTNFGTNPDLEINPSNNCQENPNDFNYTGSGEIQFDCSLFTEYTHAWEFIYNDEVWNNVHYKIREDLHIYYDKDLIVNNSIIEMGENSKIYVKEGAKLILNNSTITHIEGCDDTWAGIEVWGDPTESQGLDANGDYAQGYVELNNSYIKHAETGVYLGKVSYYYTFDGGILKATGSDFINCKRAVYFPYYANIINVAGYEYERNNISNFEECNFILDDACIFDISDIDHLVRLEGVKGITFEACSFINNIDRQYNDLIGLLSSNSSFSIKGKCNTNISPCNDWEESTFEGFWCAIKAYNIDDSESFTVRNSKFIDNGIGIRASIVNNIAVFDNEFQIGENLYEQQDCEDAPGIGIDLINSSGFALESNDFSKYTAAPSGNYTGISIFECNAMDEVFNNDFSNLSYANFASGRNWGNDYFEGLSYICNENANNFADFYVSDEGFDKGIQLMQGSSALSPGNKFSSTASWHFYNGGDHQVDYYYTNPGSIEEPNNNLLYNTAKYLTTNSNTCSNHYGGNDELNVLLSPEQQTQIEIQFYQNYTNYNNVKVLYDDLIDGGDTDGEIIDIKNAQPEDMWELRAQLLGDSPHLSLEVLKEVADKTEVFPETAIFDILAANPDELKKEELITYLEEKEDPLPDYMINILQSLTTGITYKTVLQQEMANYKYEYTRSANEMIRSIKANEILDRDLLRNWLDNLGGIQADREIISSFIEEDNFTDALVMANMLPQLYKMDDNDITDNYNYISLIEILQTLYSENRHLNQINAIELDQLEQIAYNSDLFAGTMARNILEFVEGGNTMICRNYDQGNSSYKSGTFTNNELAMAYGLQLAISPNPANAWVEFEYTMPLDENRGNISVVDASGKTIETISINTYQGKKLWDTSNWNNGVYTITLKSGDLLFTDRLIIVK